MARGQEWNEFFQFAGPSFDVARDVMVFFCPMLIEVC